MRVPTKAAAAILAAAFACVGQSPSPAVRVDPEAGENRIANIRQLTFAGENAEAYFSADGKQIIFQSTRDGRTCDQQYIMRDDGSGVQRVSNGIAKTTCGYFMDGDRRVIFASSHAVDSVCPARPDASQGYVWRLDPFDIYSAKPDGSELERLTNYGVYTAEGIVSPDGKKIVFTSLKDGDLDIYTMNIDGTGVRRLTTTPGYDGGPWWSPDGKRIIYRAYHPTGAELTVYQELLAQRLVRPNRMELFVMDADGSNQRQVTRLGGANFGPSWAPDGRIIFSSNHHLSNRRSSNFDLFLIALDGTRLEQITFSPVFDGFPMFSPDGKRVIWASNRHAALPTETNIFIADWIQ